MELVEKYLHGKFAEWGIRFIAVVDHVDTQDRAGKKARQINGLINEWYLEDLSDNVRSVLTHKRWQGDYIATFALYGYRKDPADHSRLLPDPEAAAVVRHIYALYLQGYGTARIAHILNAEGIPPPSGKGKSWSSTMVLRLLRGELAPAIRTENRAGMRFCAAVGAVIAAGTGRNATRRTNWRIGIHFRAALSTIHRNPSFYR